MTEHNQIRTRQNEAFHDACGIGFIADSTGKSSKKVLEYAIEALKNMSHRGAAGADERTGDGTGILVNIPFDFFTLVLEEELGVKPRRSPFGIGMFFTSEAEFPVLFNYMETKAELLQLRIIGKRVVPVNTSVLGEIGKKTCPLIMQIFVEDTGTTGVTIAYDFETRLYLLRKATEQYISGMQGDTFICSLSSQTMVYKGMMKPAHLARFYQDLTQPEFQIKVALFHDRFSTNTISNWAMAQPFRMLGHNGEINTIKGNRAWMLSRETEIEPVFWNDHLSSLTPIVSQVGSDSYSLDNILEFLVRSGRSLFHSIMMLIPEPYMYDSTMPKQLVDFYSYHENLIEPWDGPAALVFTDGKTVGAKLDRNGLRPLRYSLLKDGIVIMASEAGVVEVDEDNILLHHHMRSGENFALQLDGSGFIHDEAIKQQVSSQFTNTTDTGISHLSRGNSEEEFAEFRLPEHGFDKRLRIAFGFDKEDIERFIFPMAETGRESLGSMGDDSPPALFSFKHRRFTHFFKQQFAQVTNPPIDSIRERYVMSLYRYMGSEAGLLNSTGDYSGAIRIEGPVLSPKEVRILKEKNASHRHATISCLLPVEMELQDRISQICAECESAVLQGAKLIFLSDEGVHAGALPIPMLLIVAAVHQHLLSVRLRNKCSLLCFSGDICEDHDIACLIAFGASAVYPYMAYELICEQYAAENYPEKLASYRSALEKGLLKIMAKMGISTLSSYHGSFLFNAIGLSQELCRSYFPTISCALGGLDSNAIKEKLTGQGRLAFIEESSFTETGRFRFRKDGEAHGFSPAVFKTIHNQAKDGKGSIDAVSQQPVYIRDFVDLVKESKVSLSEVESIAEIKKRFGLGAISFGAISEEVHRTLAKASSILGIRSNTGEGGEQKDRYSISNPDRSENCYTKQIASGRFGVTAAYLTAAREIQIKMGQGAKPGEGGQLPGDKVTLSIANDRHTTPGVPLISPPPHHDIYSIEDLAQLIYDLKQVNPRAKICVKLVSQFGIGIIASGVVKAGADIILVSGHDGGTGASPLGSIKNTGFPWEIGLTEVHRTLLRNGLRNRVVLRVDGGLKSARDIIVAATLGAEEFDFGTSALVALGCVMARQCHLNTCPVGIATQDKELRKRFNNSPDRLVNYINLVAEEVREQLSEMGFVSLDEIIGRNELLVKSSRYDSIRFAERIDLSFLFEKIQDLPFAFNAKLKYKPQPAKEEVFLDETAIEEVRPAVMAHGRAIVTRKLKNTDRAVGSRLSGLISFLYGPSEFKGYIQYRLNGAAGQSLGAFLVDNVELRLCGVANDYVGKGMSGGLITIRFPKEIRKSLEGNTIIGNVALYGATGGELLVAGRAGERFAVRNSGAAAVVEGVGNHCCEYMTRGLVIVLGETGKNFGSGMTGGAAFVYDIRQQATANLNTEYVRTATIEATDEDLLLKYLVNHKFHTGSTIADAILENWEQERQYFVKIVPKALDVIDLRVIYEEQYKNRLMEVFNE